MQTITYIYIRVRRNGLPIDQGGYTLACRLRPDGYYAVSISQCPSDVTWNKAVGKSAAATRLNHGRFMVKTLEEIEQVAQALSNKSCEGLQPRIDVSHVVLKSALEGEYHDDDRRI